MIVTKLTTVHRYMYEGDYTNAIIFPKDSYNRLTYEYYIATRMLLYTYYLNTIKDNDTKYHLSVFNTNNKLDYTSVYELNLLKYSTYVPPLNNTTINTQPFNKSQSILKIRLDRGAKELVI